MFDKLAMSDIFPINNLMKVDNASDLVIEQSSIQFSTIEAKHLLTNIIRTLTKIDRFKEESGLDHWFLEISLSDDEGVEFLIRHQLIPIVVLNLADDELYDENEIYDHISIDSIYIDDYGELLKSDKLKQLLVDELRFWEIDSDYHAYAIDHLIAILNLGYNLPTFGGNSDTVVEFIFDYEEIFISAVDDIAMENPDYNLIHDEFDLENPERSIEKGLQNWTEIEEEDSDWTDDYDTEFWDTEEEIDWDSNDL